MPSALLIADAVWVVNDIQASLSRGDWQIEVLDDPVQAAGRAAETHPDVVLVDLQVRNMGGMAVVRDIKATLTPEVMPRLVILLDRAVDGFLAKRAGADAWVVKPFTDHDLRVALGVLEALPPEGRLGTQTLG
jgi:two-component system KDP operon response regulator KdpE